MPVVEQAHKRVGNNGVDRADRLDRLLVALVGCPQERVEREPVGEVENLGTLANQVVERADVLVRRVERGVAPAVARRVVIDLGGVVRQTHELTAIRHAHGAAPRAGAVVRPRRDDAGDTRGVARLEPLRLRLVLLHDGEGLGQVLVLVVDGPVKDAHRHALPRNGARLVVPHDGRVAAQLDVKGAPGLGQVDGVIGPRDGDGLGKPVGARGPLSVADHLAGLVLRGVRVVVRRER